MRKGSIAAMAAEERRIAHYIGFIGEGKSTRALGEALTSAGRKAAALLHDLQAYEASAQAVFKAPPVEWFAHRPVALHSVLEAERTRSALALRRASGPTRLVPMTPEVGKAHYQAETAIQVLNLLEAPEGGLTWLRWWTQSQPIRTLAELQMSFALHETRPPFAYRHLADRASELWRLGMSASAVSMALGVSDKTIAKALRDRVKTEHLVRGE
jgi:hypothetical protein